MRTHLRNSAAALALVGVIASSIPAMAGPVPGNLASVGAAAPSSVVEVRRRGGGAGVAAGIVAGAIVGGLIAGAANPYYGPGPYYYGPGPYYGPGYDEGPVYYRPRYYRPAPVYVEPGPVYIDPPAIYDPNGPVRRCWVSTDKDRGFGYWAPCR
jgi:hypothetical protein